MRQYLFTIALLLLAATPLLAASRTLDETVEAAFAAEDEGDFQQVIDLLEPIIDQIPADSVQEKSDVLSSITVSYYRLGELEQALKYGKRCLEYDEQTGIQENVSSSLSNLAAICSNMRRLDEARDFLLRSLPIEQELGRDDKLAIRLGMLGEVYTLMGKNDEALANIEQALELDRAGGREGRVAVRLSQKAQTLLEMREFAQALPVLQEAISLHRKHQNMPSLAMSLLSLSAAQRAQQHYTEAEHAIQECIDITTATGQKQVLTSAYLELSRLYDQQHDPRAYGYLKQAMELKDTISNERVQQQISDLQVAYETKEKEQQIALQQATISHQHLLFIGLGALLILALAALYFAHRALKLKEQNMQLKDRFVQLISHDLKNPALAQQKNLHGLLRYHKMLAPDELTEQLTSMAQAADAQVGLLYDLLDWGGLQTGRLTYQPVQLDLQSLTQRVVDQHKGQAQVKGIDLRVEVAGNDHLVHTDRQMTEAMLRNLLSNAIKFTPEQGQITVSIDQHTVTVTDTGIGFDPDQIAPQRGTAGELGTSLGLNLVQKMAQINHANIEISSKKGIGTRVKVSL